MYNWEIWGAVRTEFWNRYEQMKAKDTEIDEGFQEFMELLKKNGMPEEQRGEIEDGIISMTAPMITLGYFMGIQDGADMIETLRDRKFTENILEMYGTLKKEGSAEAT